MPAASCAKCALRHLVAHLGVQLADRHYFAPFEREFLIKTDNCAYLPTS